MLRPDRLHRHRIRADHRGLHRVIIIITETRIVRIIVTEEMQAVITVVAKAEAVEISVEEREDFPIVTEMVVRVVRTAMETVRPDHRAKVARYVRVMEMAAQ